MMRTNDRRKETVQTLFSPGILLQIFLMILSLGTMYGIFQTRLSTQESSLVQFEQRYEREVVPRSEHVQMNGILEQRLIGIIDRQVEEQKQIEMLQNKIDQLLTKK